ncbi:MAG: N-6 DNA methylase [Campylobacterota bacterium]|nr:N-6 DNA methylase [Campylobacterota bacterium]
MELIKALGFTPKENRTNIYEKKYPSHNSYTIEIDIEKKIINFGNKIFFNDSDKTTQNITKDEDEVVLECVDRLLIKGYSPQNIILEKVWDAGHGHSGRLDILVTRDDKSAYMMIECKTWGKEFDKALIKLNKDGGQLFTYFRFDTKADILVLYASRLDNNSIGYINQIVKIEDEYRETSNLKDFYDRWNKISKNNGVFDSWTTPYSYKSQALTPVNLIEIKQEDSSFIFNRFMEILRHNVVSDKPNAFSKIFTLFLCKIMDEKITKPNEELGFQWLEGIDTHITFQKRLTDLYQKGMKEFLDKEVTDLSDDEFEEKFGTLDSSLKQQLLDEFTKIRLQKNNEFAIKDVFDQDTFEENAIVVKEVVELLQNYQIRYTKKQQFLSDFFELLLTTGLKQEVGQFFTPVPIAKFIIRSIPLDKIMQEKLSKGVKDELLPNVIDYAVGSGHFITEAMDEIQKYINSSNPDEFISDTSRKLKSWKEDHFDWAYDYVYGIEKDYRLVKTAKVGCYLHGDGLAKVIHGDGLSNFTNTKEFKGKLVHSDKNYPQDNKKFDIVISNPPYSVSAFKNISKKFNSDDFELYNRLTDQSSEIEALFIERTKQLLKDGGIAGIILPSSILSNGGIYSKVREIIFKYFDIISIAKLGSNTFMATGTNTVVLFLRRKNNMEYKNIEASVSKLFETKQDITINGIENPLTKYINYVWEDIDLEDYITLLQNNPNEKIKSSELYIDHIKKMQKIEDILNLEKEKLAYFIYAYKQKVTIVKTGEKKEEKRFLGYEFSSRRGNEGIHPIQRGKSIDESTSLYDDSSYTNSLKANSYICSAFGGEYQEIDESLKDNISYIDLVDMMIFDRVDFDKSISLNVKKKVKIDFIEKLNRYKQEKISSFSIINPSKKEISSMNENTIVSFIEMASVSNNGFIETKVDKSLKELKKGSFTYFKDNDIIIAKITPSMENGKCAIAEKLTNNIALGSSEFHVIRVNKNIKSKYLFTFLNTSSVRIEAEKQMTGASGHRRVPVRFYENIKIPLPPKDIQEKIVEENEVLEIIENNNNKKIKELKAEIDKILLVQGVGKPLGEICEMKAGTFVSASNISDEKSLENYPCYGGNGLRGYTKTFTHNGTYSLVGRQGALCGNIHTVSGKFHATEHALVVTPLSNTNATWLEYKLREINLNQYATGTAQPGLSVKNLINIPISLPSLKQQKEIVSKIEVIEKEIAIKEKELESIPKQKEEILKKYL